MQVSVIYILIFCLLAALWISKSLTPIMLLIAKKKRLYDDGKDVRKFHEGLIPNLGGVALFTAFILTFSASSFADDIQGYGYFVAASVIIFGAGLKDDLIVISPRKKIAAQFFASALIMFGCGFQFTNLGGVFGVGSIPGWAGIPLTFFTVIVVTNAMNLIDGIDGLAGVIGIAATAFFGWWFYMAGLYAWAVFSAVLIGSTLGFLWYNRPPAKIFMGDNGSLVIGFYLAILAINFVEHSITEPVAVFWQPAASIIVAAALVVPLYDTLRVFIVRVVNGKSPLDADSNHVHHHLLKAGFSHKQIDFLLFGLNTIILGSVIGLSGYLSNTWLLVSLLGISAMLFPTNRWKRELLKSLVTPQWNPETKETVLSSEGTSSAVTELSEQDKRQAPVLDEVLPAEEEFKASEKFHEMSDI